MTSPKPYAGSCHCGAIQYKVKLSFPPNANTEGDGCIRIYKCNCSTCHKMGLFHCRPADLRSDFILVSPSSVDELGAYRTAAGSGHIQWYFCRTCGVRPFGLGGVWEQVDVDAGEWRTEKEGESNGGKKLKVWMPRPKGVFTYVDDDGKEVTKPLEYFSVNAATLEPGGEVDLKAWHEKQWIIYVENRYRVQGGPHWKVGVPHEGGMY